MFRDFQNWSLGFSVIFLRQNKSILPRTFFGPWPWHFVGVYLLTHWLIHPCSQSFIYEFVRDGLKRRLLNKRN